MRRPYIGVTGFMTREEVDNILNLIPPSSKQLLMVGVLASWKTLYEGKESNRYPRTKNISGIFTSHPLALNLIHYHTKKTETLCEQLSSLAILGGKNFHGFQLNFAWPPISELEKYRSICQDNIIVMVITPQAFEDIGNYPQVLVSRIEDYKGLVDYVLLDMSGGRGITLNTEYMRKYVETIYNENLDMGIGVAGGLCSDTLYLVEPLIKEFQDISIDAEGKLRNHDDSLNLDFTKSYLYDALRIFGGNE